MAQAALSNEDPGLLRPFVAGLRSHLASTPGRIRKVEYWYVQALAFGAVAVHYGIQASGIHTPYNVLHMASVALVTAPMLVAALWFGWPGAFFTAIEIVALTAPSTFIWHRAVSQWITEAVQLLLTLPVGFLVAWRITREEGLRTDAERTSEGLALLNRVAAMTRRSGDDPVYLLNTVRAIRDHLGADFAWVVLEQEGERRVVATDTPGVSGDQDDTIRTALSFHDSLVGGVGTLIQRRGYWVKEITGELWTFGSLGVFTSDSAMLSQEQERLLDTVAAQVGTSIEVAELFRLRQRDLQTYTNEITRAQEAERLRLARDLHDDTVQQLTEVVRRIDALPAKTPEAIADEAKDVAEAARGTLRSLREQTQRLRPPLLDELGIVGALDSLIAAEESLAGGLTFAVAGNERRLGEELELALFRIVQEALTNIRNHAQATTAMVRLDFGNDSVELTVSDNGRGFEVPARLAM